jgi:hypothetical protein
MRVRDDAKPHCPAITPVICYLIVLYNGAIEIGHGHDPCSRVAVACAEITVASTSFWQNHLEFRE